MTLKNNNNEKKRTLFYFYYLLIQWLFVIKMNIYQNQNMENKNGITVEDESKKKINEQASKRETPCLHNVI